MKIIDINFNKELKGKTLNIGTDSVFTEEAVLKFTGNTRRIKNIFGKVKEQAEFYILTKKYNLWNTGEYKTVKRGPYWHGNTF